jgi:hypothetical protein
MIMNRTKFRLLTDDELAAGIGVAVEEGDREWLKNLIVGSETGQGLPPEFVDEFVDMVMGDTNVEA